MRKADALQIDGLIREVVLKRQRSHQIFSWNCWYFFQYGTYSVEFDRTCKEELVLAWKNGFLF